MAENLTGGIASRRVRGQLSERQAFPLIIAASRQRKAGGYGSYGYQSYVDRSQYQYYFQQGFQRGYEDGYNSRNQYGSNNGGSILGAILGSILNIQSY